MAMGAGQLPAVDARAGAGGIRLDLDGVCRWSGVGDSVVTGVDDINLHVDEAVSRAADDDPPLFTLRRLRRTDIPATLRDME